MKRFRVAALLLALAVVLGSVAMAAGRGKTVTIFPGVTITVNGKTASP